MLNLSGLARQYLADTTQRSASFSRTCAPSRFQLQAWQKLTRPASVRWRRDVDSDSAVTHTNAHTNTSAQKCPGSSNSPCPVPSLADKPSLPRAAATAIDQSAWLPLFVAPLPWQLFALGPGWVARQPGRPTLQLRFRQHFIILIFNRTVSWCAYRQHAKDLFSNHAEIICKFNV